MVRVGSMVRDQDIDHSRTHGLPQGQHIANRIAESVIVGVNPYNGATEVTRIQDVIQQDAGAVEQARRAARAELDAARRYSDRKSVV